MKKIIQTFLAIAVVAISLSSCKKDKLEPLIPSCNARMRGGTDGVVQFIQYGCTVHEIEFAPGKDEISK